MPPHVACRADDSDKHQNDVNQVIFHQGKLYSAADDGKVKVWAPDLKFLQEVQAHSTSIFSITASNDTLYSCSNDGSVKAWDLNTLKEKSVLINDPEVEFWKVKYDQGVLYAGDDQGNLRIYKDDKFYASINVAIPVKDLAIQNNLVFASKDNDVIVTDLQISGAKPQFGIKGTIMGRGPLVLIDDKSVFISRDGKDIILSVIGESQHLKEVSKITGAHEMIINGAAATKLNGNIVLCTAGWDKLVKLWKIEDNSLKADGSIDAGFVVNAMVAGENGQVYIGGSDGHIGRVDL